MVSHESRPVSGSSPQGPVGVMDSGVGGLSVLRVLVQRLPHERWLYLADQAHLPYGLRSEEELREFAFRLTEFLLAQGIKALVVACNTLSAVALEALRARYPFLPIVGMEPALKPAALSSRTGRIGVMATRTTLQSHRYRRLKARFASQVSVVEDPCMGLVEQVEKGELHSPATRRMLERILAPMKQAGIDTLVLGCTHFPFLKDTLHRVLGPGVTILDPAEAVARRLAYVLQHRGLVAKPPPNGHAGSSLPSPILAWTTGDARRFAEQARQLVPELPLHVQALSDFWEGPRAQPSLHTTRRGGG